MMAAALLAAGCGSSSNGSSGGSHKSSAKSSKPPAKTTTVASTTTTTNSPPTTTSSSAPTSFASAANCLKLDGVSAKFAQAMESMTGKNSNETAVAADFQSLADAAPSAIRPDLETVAKAFTSFTTALTKSGYSIGKTPTAAQTAAMAAAMAAFNQPKLKAAETALQAWGKKNCS